MCSVFVLIKVLHICCYSD